MNRIAFSGKMGSGKTSLSTYLIDNGYERVSLAGPLKEFAALFANYNEDNDFNYWADMIGMLRELDKPYQKFSQYPDLLQLLYDDVLITFRDIKTLENKTEDVRKLLQTIGQRFREIIDQNVWVDYLINSLDPNKKYVIDDMRYVNEYEKLVAAGFVAIRLKISEEVRRARLQILYGELSDAALNHISEVALDDIPFAYYVSADADLESAINELKYILKPQRVVLDLYEDIINKFIDIKKDIDLLKDIALKGEQND